MTAGSRLREAGLIDESFAPARPERQEDLAMLDACEPALALASAGTVDEALISYEKTMPARADETGRMFAAFPGGDPD